VSWFDLPSAGSLAVFFCGWLAGWFVFRRARLLPHTELVRQMTVSVVIPCRNEADNLKSLLPTVRSALSDADEIIVVDDDSSDETVSIAEQHGVVVLRAGALPDGWTGKSHACYVGARSATRECLLFIDADVRVGPHAITDVIGVLEQYPDAVVSAMPWHRTVGTIERLSMLFNAISAMVASQGKTSGSRRVAYGPFLAVRRDTYVQTGGHSHVEVRGSIVDDLAFASVMPRAIAYIADKGQVEYRMYPQGVRQLWEGWTKNTAVGALSVPRLTTVLIVAWIISLCGGPFVSGWCYVLSAGQIAIMARRVGNFGLVSALTYPLHAVFFVVVSARSAVRSVVVGRVGWRGRTITTR